MFTRFKEQQKCQSFKSFFFHLSVKQIEQNQEDESSDSSDDDDDDVNENVVEPKRSSRQFTFDNIPKANGTSNTDQNGQQMKRQPTRRRTKQKGYWNSFLSNILEK